MVWLLLLVATACYAHPAPVLPDPLHHSGLYPQLAQGVQNAQPNPVGFQLAQQPVILHSLPTFNPMALNGQPGLPQMPTFPNQIPQNPQFPVNTLHNIPNLNYNMNPLIGQNYQNSALPMLSNGLNTIPMLQMQQPAQSPWGLSGGQQFAVHQVPSHFEVMQRLMNPTVMINNPSMLGAPTFQVGAPLYNQVPIQQYPPQLEQPVAQQMPVSGYNTAQTQRAATSQVAPAPLPAIAQTQPTPATTASTTPVPFTTTTTERATEAPIPEESDECSEEVQQSTGVTVPPLQQSASGKIVSARATALQMHLTKAEATTTTTLPPAIEVITSTRTAPVTLQYRKNKLKNHLAKINGQKVKKQSRRKEPRKRTRVATTTESGATEDVTTETTATETATETTATIQESTTTPQPMTPKVLNYQNIENIKKLEQASVSKLDDKPYTLTERKEMSQNGSQVFQGSDGKLYTMNSMTQVKTEATVTEILSRVLDAVLPAQSIKDLISENDKIAEGNDVSASNSLAARSV